MPPWRVAATMCGSCLADLRTGVGSLLVNNGREFIPLTPSYDLWLGCPHLLRESFGHHNALRRRETS